MPVSIVNNAINPKFILRCEEFSAVQAQVECNLALGAYSYARHGGILGGLKSIGRYCSIAPRVYCGGGEHPTDWLSTHPFQYAPSKLIRRGLDGPLQLTAPGGPKPSTIGHDVWIGGGAIIKRGIDIQNGAVIAAGAVVTKDVPAYAVVGGVPAKVIRYSFDEATIAALQAIAWWNYTAKSLYGLPFNDIHRAIAQLERRLNADELVPIPEHHYVVTPAGEITKRKGALF